MQTDTRRPAQASTSTPTAFRALARPALLALGALCLIALAAFARGRGDTLAKSPEPRATALEVRVVELELVDGYGVERRFSGEVRARATALLAFEQSEPLVELLVSEGQSVEAGAPLARLDTAELEADLALERARTAEARATLAELRAGPREEALAAAVARVAELEQRLELAELTADRRTALASAKHVPEEEADSARFDAAAQAHALDGARELLRELENGTRLERVDAAAARLAAAEAAVAGLEARLADATLAAPFDGVVGRVMAELGSIPSPGAPVLELVAGEPLEAWIGLPPDLALELELGREVALRTADGALHAAVASARLPQLDPTTRTRTVLFELADARLGELVPGQRIDLSHNERTAEPGYWLPTTALVRSRRGLWAAYAIAPGDHDASATIERREVELLHTTGDRAYVRGTLAPGERLVRDGVQRIVDGQAVRIVETAPLAEPGQR